MLYRQHVYETEGVFSALIRVQTRADGLLWGALAAAVLPYAQRLRRYAGRGAGRLDGALVPLLGAVVDEVRLLRSRRLAAQHRHVRVRAGRVDGPPAAPS